MEAHDWVLVLVTVGLIVALWTAVPWEQAQPEGPDPCAQERMAPATLDASAWVKDCTYDPCRFVSRTVLFKNMRSRATTEALENYLVRTREVNLEHQ